MREEQPLAAPCSGSAPSHPGALPPSWAGLVLAVLPAPSSARGQACPSLNTPELTLAVTPAARRLGRQGCPGHLSPLLGETLVVFSGRGWGPGAEKNLRVEFSKKSLSLREKCEITEIAPRPDGEGGWHPA